MALLHVLRGDPNRHAKTVSEHCRQLRGIRDRFEAPHTDHMHMAMAITGEQARRRWGQGGG